MKSLKVGSIALLLCIGIGLSVHSASVKQKVFLPTGYNFLRSILYARTNVWCGFVSSPARLVRFNNPDDITDFTTLVFSAGHTNLYDLAYRADNDRIYCCFYQGNGFLITELDPTNLTYTDVVLDTTNGAWGEQIAFTATNVFVTGILTSGYGGTIKYKLSDWSLQGVCAVAPALMTVGCRFDGTNIWLIDDTDNPTGSFVRVNPNTLANTLTYLDRPGMLYMTGHSVFPGTTYMWNGLEQYGTLVRINKLDLSVTYVSTGIPTSATWDLFYDSTASPYMWHIIDGFPGTPSVIQRVDPDTGYIWDMSMDPGEEGAIRVTANSTRLFVGSSGTPASLISYTFPLPLNWRTGPQPGPRAPVTISGFNVIRGNVQIHAQ